MRKWIIVCALVGTVAHAAPPPQALPQFSDRDRRAKLSTAFADIDRLFAEFAKTAHVPGAAWGVVIDGELAHSGSAGVRDVASGAAVDADTVFRIASMTKSFTAMAILKLRDEGKLSLGGCQLGDHVAVALIGRGARTLARRRLARRCRGSRQAKACGNRRARRRSPHA